jgi:hypothetical protein
MRKLLYDPLTNSLRTLPVDAPSAGRGRRLFCYIFAEAKAPLGLGVLARRGLFAEAIPFS